MLNFELDLAEILTAYQKRSGFRKRYASLSIHKSNKPLRHTAPQIDRQAVACSDDIVRADGEVHRNHVGLAHVIAEYFETEAFRRTRRHSSLHIHVIQGGHIGVRVCRS